MARFRTLKPKLLERLKADDWEEELDCLCNARECEAVGPLFTFLLHAGVVRWRAITALGGVVLRMTDGSVAGSDIGDARVILRRLMWNLNEESGNVAWGAPEAMGEILARHEVLAREFHTILISYVQDLHKSSNFLDHAPLRRGAYWGIGRLAEARPEMAAKGAGDLIKAVTGEQDMPSRGVAAWALGVLADAGVLDQDQTAGAKAALARAAADPVLQSTRVELFRARKMEFIPAASLAGEALEKL